MNAETKKKEPEEILEGAFHAFETLLNGEKNSSLHLIRTKAFQRFIELGFPGLKDEEYKYTHLKNKIPAELHPVISPETESETIISDPVLSELPDFPRIIYTNGVLTGEIPDVFDSDERITIRPLAELMKEDPQIITEYLDKELENIRDPFIPLNTAMASNGLYIEVKEGVEIEQPLFIIHRTGPAISGLYMNNRNIIIGQKGSKLKIAEIFTGRNGQAYFENNCTSLYLKKESNINYTKIQLSGDQAVHVGTTLVNQDKTSMFKSTAISLSGGMVRNNLNVYLNEENCESHLYGLFFPSGKDHIDNHTTVDHRVPNCFSNELYKGIMDDQGKGVFNGKIFVRPQAQKTNAYQSNKNLLLTDAASVNTKPQLEIWADDVKCTHGTSTGKLDNEQLFYLRSRGIDSETAKSLLIYAFTREVTDKIDIGEISDITDKILQIRLGQSFA